MKIIFIYYNEMLLYHDYALLHHGSRTFAKCLLRSRLAHCVREYYIR